MNDWLNFEEKARKAIEQELKIQLQSGKVNINDSNSIWCTNDC